MKRTLRTLVVAMLIIISRQTYAQGTLIFDQQSATSPAHPIGNGNVDGLNLQTRFQTNSFTQSFIPALSAIGFVQLEFEDLPNNGTNGATVSVNLWTGSPNINFATFLGSTAPVYMPDGYVTDNLLVAGVATFYFPTQIALNPGQTYYLQPVFISGDSPWAVVALTYDAYPNGQLFSSGLPSQPSIDLWFREGIVVPEPTTLVLLGAGSLLIFALEPRKALIPILGLSVTKHARA